jgi:hypothetical protein
MKLRRLGSGRARMGKFGLRSCDGKARLEPEIRIRSHEL